LNSTSGLIQNKTHDITKTIINHNDQFFDALKCWILRYRVVQINYNWQQKNLLSPVVFFLDHLG